MSDKNSSAIKRGAALAQLKLTVPKTSPHILLSDMEKGNRSQRRTAAKQRRREHK